MPSGARKATFLHVILPGMTDTEQCETICSVLLTHANCFFFIPFLVLSKINPLNAVARHRNKKIFLSFVCVCVLGGLDHCLFSSNISIACCWFFPGGYPKTLSLHSLVLLYSDTATVAQRDIREQYLKLS